MAREHTRTCAAAGELPAEQVASWWSADGQHEIDLAGVTAGTQIRFIGTVKWSARPLGREVLANLEAHAAVLPGYYSDIPRLVYSRGGCRATLARTAGIRCYSVADTY